MQNNDQPPSASGERDAFEAWYSINAFDYVANPVGSRDCGLQWKAWKARAALAPSPGIDAAEPVAWLTSDGKMLVFADKISNGRAQHSGMTPLYAAPPAAQPSAEWLAEAERLVDAYANEFAQGGATYARDIRRTALLAHLRSPHAPT